MTLFRSSRFQPLEWVAVLLLLLPSCSSKLEHAPPLANPTGTGGSSTGGDGSSGDGGDFGAGGTDFGAGGRRATGGRSNGGRGGGGTGGGSGGTDAGDAGGPDSGGTIPLTGLANGQFDPNDLYLFGTLSEGACYRDAVARVSDPNTFVTGFDCDADDTVHLRNGRLVYKLIGTQDSMYQFSPDYYGNNPGFPYPPKPEGNDAPVPAPGCGTRYIGAFLTSPDGRLIYSCQGSSWFEGTAPLIGADVPIIAFGFDGLLLTSDLDSLSLRRIGVDAAAAIPTNPPLAKPVAWHSSADGFHVVLADPSTHEHTLWSVSASGDAVKLGTYAQPDSTLNSGLMRPVLMADDTLIRSLTIPPFTDIIVRFETDGSSATLYTEATNPTVKIHISEMFTGP